MDVYCTRCSESWDNYHLRHDEIMEIDLPDSWKKDWDGKLVPIVRKAFEDNGWLFGKTVYNIKQCPACNGQPETKQSRARFAISSALEDVMAGDDDGLVSELNSLGHDLNMEGE